MLKQLILGVCFSCTLLSFSQEEIVFTAEPEILSNAINTSNFNEGNPKISADGSRLYFIRWNHPQNYGEKHDIWYSDFVNNKWQQAIQMQPPITNKGGSNTSVETIFPDGNTMVLFGYYSRMSDDIRSGFSIVKKDKKGWGYPIPQQIEKLVNKSNTTGYCLAPSGKQAIIFIKHKGEGEHDLFVTFLGKKKNTWSKPLNMGKVINSKGEESTPFISADGKTLFFSSDGHGGYGNNDVFMSKRLDDTWQNWSKPINLGSKINSENYDAYFSIDAAGEYAYFTSNKLGKTDIYRISLAEEAKPDPLVLISGKALNQKTDEPVASKIVYFDLENNTEIGYANSDPIDGNYKIALPKGKKYAYYAQAKNFYTVREHLDLIELGEYQELERNLYLAPIEKGEIVRLNNIFFDFGKATLLPESYAELDKLVETLEQNATIKIKIKGHTDNIGSDTDNKTLSQKRANAVYSYLTDKKINVNRLDFEGYGETKPIATNDTDKGKALNRRVEFEIL